MEYSFFNMIDRYCTKFEGLFKSLNIKRISNDDTVTNIRVPIMAEYKSKRYMLDNSDLGNVGIVLPIIGIKEPIKQRFEEAQRLYMSDIYSANEIDANIAKSLKNPIPYKFTFEVNVYAKYVSDLRQIEEQIIGEFSQTKVVPMNLIPEYGVYFEMPVKLNDSFIDMENLEMVPMNADDNMKTASFLFDVYVYLFRATDIRKLIKYTILRTKDLRLTSTLENRTDDIIRDSDNTIIERGKDLLDTIEIDSEVDINVTYLFDTTEFAMANEYITVEDNNGNSIPYTFEYSNGEFYAHDSLAPDTRVITRLNRIAINMKLNKGTNKFKVFHIMDKSYYRGEDCFLIYNDFNNRNMLEFNIFNKSRNNLYFINDGYMNSITLFNDDIHQQSFLVTEKAITEKNVVFETRMSNYNYEEDVNHRLSALMSKDGSTYLSIQRNVDSTYTLNLITPNTNTVLYTFINILPLSFIIRYTVLEDGILISCNNEEFTYVTDIEFSKLCLFGGNRFDEDDEGIMINSNSQYYYEFVKVYRFII